MSEAAQIYIELGSDVAKQYEDLREEEDQLLLILRETGHIDDAELIRIRNEIYQLRQDARIVSQR